MRIKIDKYFFIVAFVAISACSSQTYEQRLKSYVEDTDNKITQKISIANIDVTTKFLASPYRAVMNKDDSTTDDSFYHFDIKFNRREDSKLTAEKISYLNFDMLNDFVLLANDKDSIIPSFCQRIENGISNNYEYIVVFEKGKNQWKDFTLYYHDKIFSIGSIAFVYKEDDILKIPGKKEKI